MNVSFLQELLNTVAEQSRALLPKALFGHGEEDDLEPLARALMSGRGEASGVAIAKLAFSAWSGTSGTIASVGPAVHSLDSNISIDSPAGVRMDYTTAASDRVAIMWSTVAEQPTANVRRLRPVFDLRIDSAGANPTVIKWEMDSYQVGIPTVFAAFSASHHHTVGKAWAPYLGSSDGRA